MTLVSPTSTSRWGFSRPTLTKVFKKATVVSAKIELRVRALIRVELPLEAPPRTEKLDRSPHCRSATRYP